MPLSYVMLVINRQENYSHPGTNSVNGPENGKLNWMKLSEWLGARQIKKVT